MTNMRMLYLHQNKIEKIEGLSTMTQLHTLNLSHNLLTSVDGLQGLDQLKTIDLSYNQIKDLEKCRAVKNLRSITSIDMSNNKIDDVEEVFTFFNEIECAELVVLALKCNPFCPKTSNYRNMFITQLPSLGHLDDRPVFTLERGAAMAWKEGGREAERKYRDEQKAKEREETR